MMFIVRVESGARPIKLRKDVLVAILVAVAVSANFWAFNRVAEIRREADFRERLTRNLDELIQATEAVAATCAAR